MNSMLSIIIPAYNEERMVDRTENAISAIMLQEGIRCELLFVDDGSTDDTWERILALSNEKQNVRGLRFSRNFGKESAIFAGLEHAAGDCCAVIDCDLQHPPEKLVDMYRLWQQGYEVVEGIKEDRGQQGTVHGAAAGVFYRLISRSTGMDMSSASDFKLLDRKVVDALNQMPERSVFFRALSYWVGYKRTSVSYRVQKRVEGESKWSAGALIRYALTNITSFSSAPLHVVTLLGIIMLVFAFSLGTLSLVQKFMGRSLGGFTTVIVISLFSSSLIMISLGIIGYYIGKIYEEIKGRPRYFIAGRCGDKPNN